MGLTLSSTNRKVVDIYGGIDIMVSNAGAAWQGEIGKVNSAVLKESFDLNFYAHQYKKDRTLQNY